MKIFTFMFDKIAYIMLKNIVKTRTIHRSGTLTKEDIFEAYNIPIDISTQIQDAFERKEDITIVSSFKNEFTCKLQLQFNIHKQA